MRREFEDQVYRQIEIEKLVLFCIDSLNSEGKSCAFEDLLKESFELFPHSFNFEKNPQWPDSRKIENAIDRLKRKKLVKGSSIISFSLTKKGEKEALRVEKTLKQRELKFSS